MRPETYVANFKRIDRTGGKLSAKSLAARISANLSLVPLVSSPPLTPRLMPRFSLANAESNRPKFRNFAWFTILSKAIFGETNERAFVKISIFKVFALGMWACILLPYFLQHCQ